MAQPTVTGRVAVVTGAGSGIGRALAVQLGAAGALVAAVDRDAGTALETVSAIRACGGQARSYAVDISDPIATADLPDIVAAELGVAGVLINNAGVMMRSVPFEQLTLADAESLHAINYWGAVRCTHAFLPQLRTSAAASIANVSSLAGLVGMMNVSSYVASKFALRGFTEALRMELIGSSITVTAVFPGSVRTGLVQNCKDYEPDEATEAVRRQERLPVRPVSAEHAARRIIRGIERRQARVLIGWDARVIDLLVRSFPSASPRLLHPVIAQMMAIVDPPRRTSVPPDHALDAAHG